MILSTLRTLTTRQWASLIGTACLCAVPSFLLITAPFWAFYVGRIFG